MKHLEMNNAKYISKNYYLKVISEISNSHHNDSELTKGSSLIESLINNPLWVIKKDVINNWDDIIYNNSINTDYLKDKVSNIVDHKVIVLNDTTLSYDEVLIINNVKLDEFYEEYFIRYKEEFWQYSEYIFFDEENCNISIITDEGQLYKLIKKENPCIPESAC